MIFFKKSKSFRLTKETTEALSELTERYPELYHSDSDVIRASVIMLLNKTREREERENASR